MMPGFTPTRRRVRFGGTVSRRRQMEDVAGVEGCRRRDLEREVSSGVVDGVRGELGVDGASEVVEEAERERVMRGVRLVVTSEDRLERRVRGRLMGS
jgi:hypothetical protein